MPMGCLLRFRVYWDSLKKKFPSLKVTLADISQAALEVAKKNAITNQVEVELVQGDLLQPFANRKTNYLVCNPPYVTEQEFPHLDSEVRHFEPRHALVAGPTGLEFYHQLAKELHAFLAPFAKVWFELGSTQGKALCEIFQKAQWKHYRVEQDWAGQDRFFFLENQ